MRVVTPYPLELGKPYKNDPPGTINSHPINNSAFSIRLTPLNKLKA